MLTILKRFFIFLLAFLLPAAGLLAGIFYVLESQQTRQAENRVDQQLQLTQRQLQRQQLHWDNVLKLTVQNELLNRFIAASQLRRPEQLRRYAPLVEKLFGTTLDQNASMIDSLRLVDSSGRERIVVNKDGVSQKLKSWGDTQFFQNLKSQQMFQVEHTAIAADGERLLFYRGLVIGAAGKMFGALIIGIDVSQLVREVESTRLFSDWTLTVSNRKMALDFVIAEPATLQRYSAETVIKDYQENAQPFSLHIGGARTNGLPIDIYVVHDKNISRQQIITQFQWPAIMSGVVIFLLAALFAYKTQAATKVKKAVQLLSIGHVDKTHFLSKISNELRIPLGSILGLTAMMRDTGLSKEQTKMISLLQHHSEYIMQALNNYLDYVRIQTSQFKINRVDFDIRTLVHDVIESQSPQADKKALELSSLTSSDLPARLLGDPTRIRQVLANILGNAIKFTDHGEVIVCVSKVSHVRKNVMVKFEVSDTGNGVDFINSARLFEAFTQGADGNSREVYGIGLGLNVAKMLVENMGGEIGVEENRKGGSKFWFTIALEEIKEVDEPMQQVSIDGYRVLVMSETQVNRNAIAATLQSWNMQVATVDSLSSVNGVLSKAADAGEPYYMLLIDINRALANQELLTLFDEVRASQASKHIRIAVLTLEGQPGDIEIAYNLGIQAYLTKPIAKDDLHRCVTQIIAYKKVSDIPLITRHSLKELKAKQAIRILLQIAPEYQQQVNMYLEELGYKADVSNDYEQSLKSISQMDYDLLIVGNQDDRIPAQKFLKKIRQRDSKRNRRTKGQQDDKLYMVLALQTIEDEESWRETGVDIITRLPLNKPALNSFIKQLLSR